MINAKQTFYTQKNIEKCQSDLAKPLLYQIYFHTDIMTRLVFAIITYIFEQSPKEIFFRQSICFIVNLLYNINTWIYKNFHQSFVNPPQLFYQSI